MGKLSAAPSRLSGKGGSRVPPVSRQQAQAQWDARTKDARSVYQTPEWREARKQFLAVRPKCVCGCGRDANTVDHVKPHRGDMALFWDRTNWQPMAFPCHQAKRGRERHERGA